jgi:hypothetical protein
MTHGVQLTVQILWTSAESLLFKGKCDVYWRVGRNSTAVDQSSKSDLSFYLSAPPWEEHSLPTTYRQIF